MRLQAKSLREGMIILEIFCLGLLVILAHGSLLVAGGQRNSLALESSMKFASSIQLCDAQDIGTMRQADLPAFNVAENTDPRQLNFIGRIFWLTGQCEAAQRVWQEAANLSASDEFVQFQLALSYYVSGEFLKSRQTFAKMNKGADLREWFAQRANVEGTPEKKLRWLELSFWAYPSRVAVRRLDKSLTMMGRNAEARLYYDRLVTLLSDETFDYWWSKGALAEMARDWESARSAYAAASTVALSASDREVLYIDLARVYQNLGNSFCADYFSHIILTDPAVQIPPECQER